MWLSCSGHFIPICIWVTRVRENACLDDALVIHDMYGLSNDRLIWTNISRILNLKRGVCWEWNDRREIEHLCGVLGIFGGYGDLKILKLRLIEKETNWNVFIRWLSIFKVGWFDYASKKIYIKNWKSETIGLRDKFEFNCNINSIL